MLWSSAPGLEVHHPDDLPPGTVIPNIPLHEERWAVADLELGHGEVVVFAGKAFPD